jgi:crotonobetainyl-CoA:carnitine CoA-transferase CaiB-like acyl-CoA transferase
VFYRLAAEADVVADNFRPAGADGRLRPHRPGHVRGHERHPPVPRRIPGPPGIPVGGLFGGIFAAIGVTAALIHRDRARAGQHVDVSMPDVMLALNTYRIPHAQALTETAGPSDDEPQRLHHARVIHAAAPAGAATPAPLPGQDDKAIAAEIGFEDTTAAEANPPAARWGRKTGAQTTEWTGPPARSPAAPVQLVAL